jgi:hypothetical protein
MFQTPTPSAAAPLPSLPVNPGSPGEFTRMMNTPSTPAENLFVAPKSRGEDLFVPRAGGATNDEFSRVAGGSRPAPVGPSARPTPPPPPPATPHKKSSMMPIVLTLVGLLIVAIVLLVIFAR